MSRGHFNGLVAGEAANVTRVLDPDRLALAERSAAQLIGKIQPHPFSDERRSAVTSYVRRLIVNCIPCKVCTFGSVPLKTYLPDGDIDLTALSGDPDTKELWANKVRHALECEEKNENAEFRVKEVQYIQAEVKLIKCLVENIVVDISFNQVGGLCTLCFLEEIDRLINNNYLFKRSIILIKAWCYYESRILGAHHGLISTYALETLVLYIFHIFNNKFTGPLEVLYRFLEFFSNYDWENYCLSLWGPVPISSLPHMIAEPPRRDDGNLLLNKPFLDGCVVRYAVFPGGQETPGQPFALKHFNVIDPLRTNNNLGRSVSKGNFFRIRSAFAFGAKRLASLLECRKEDLIAELNQFFRNTWEKHGNGIRPDAAPVPILHSLLNVSAEEPRQHRSTDYNNKKKSHSNAVPQIQKTHAVQPGLRDKFEANNTTSSSTDQKTLKPQYSLNSNSGLARFQFVRTRSSPELTDSSVESFPRTRRGRAVDIGKATRSENGGLVRRSNADPGSEISGTHCTNSSLDDFPRSFNNSLPSDTRSISNSYDNGFASISEEPSSVPETVEVRQEMSQEEQDMVNLIGMQGLNGQFQLPTHMAASPHPPMAFSHLLASGLQAQGNWAGVLPANLSSWQPKSTPEDSFSEADSESIDWASTSAGEESAPDRIPPHMGYGPVLLSSPRQRVMDNPGGVPMAFIPTGPPIPFYMVPVQLMNNNDVVATHTDREESASQADRDCESGYNSDTRVSPSPTSSSATASVTDSEERNKSDILNSDFNSHWQNLLYGRFCQNPPYQGPLIAPSPIMVPQMLLQGHFPSEGARPMIGNPNFTQVMGYGPRLIPVMPFQSGGPERASPVAPRFGEETPRSRGGTGTYLPNPKASYRERQSSTRNQRWNNNERNSDHADREGSWINAKQRAAAARRGSSGSSRTERHHHHHHHHQAPPSEHQSEAQWQTYRNDSYQQDENNPLGATSASAHRPGNMVGGYSMYLAPPGSNGVGPVVGPEGPTGPTNPPPLVMVYSYDQGGGAAYNNNNRSAEPHDEVLLPSEQRPGGSSRSTPESPSSPHSRR